MIILNALVLSEKNVGESSKSIRVLTAEKGVISIFIRGGQKSSKNSSSTQTFAYSKLCIEEKKNAKGQTNYYLNSSENLKLFYNLRLDAKRMSLASYFSDLLIYTGTEEIHTAENKEILRLTLNTFHFLNEKKLPMELLKCIFEFRMLCEIGLRPALIGCKNCLAYESETMYFDLKENNLTCKNCFEDYENTDIFPMDKTLLYIVRFIALTDYNRLFSFKISEKYQKKLTGFTEKFVEYNLKRNFSTLKFYKML